MAPLSGIVGAFLCVRRAPRTAGPWNLSPPAKPHRSSPLRKSPNAAPARPAAGAAPIAPPGGALRLLRAVIAVRMFKSLSVLRLDTAHLQQYSINYGKFSAGRSPLAVRFVRYIIAATLGVAVLTASKNHRTYQKGR